MKPTEKKKPGRPRKKAETQSLDILGVCDSPSVKEYINEFSCGDLVIIGKTIALQKTCNVNDVEFFFDVDTCRVSSTDQSRKIDIATTFDCKAIHRYYCSSPIAIRVTRTCLDKVINKLTKAHDKVTFALKSDYKQFMYCMLHNSTRQSVETYTIPTAYAGEHKEIPNLDENYPLSFCLPSKELKTKMTGLKLMSPLLVIQKVGQGPMQLTCGSNKDVDWDEIFNDGASIGMTCTLEENDILRVTVFADLVKYFAHHVIGSTILIKVDTTRKLILKSCICKGDQPIITSVALIDPGSQLSTTPAII